jgi:hypothetical protein
VRKRALPRQKRGGWLNTSVGVPLPFVSLVLSIVIAGLDPAIHAAGPLHKWVASARYESAWTTGSSPVVTKK